MTSSDELRLPPEKPVGELTWICGGEVDEYSVTLKFVGETLDPDRVSKLLGHLPTSSCRQGDIFRGKRYDRIEKHGRWIWSSGRFSDVSLDTKIDAMLDELTSDLQIWNELTNQYFSSLFCGLFLKCWNRATDLSPKTLGRIAERGLLLDLDIYFELEEESEEPDSIFQASEVPITSEQMSEVRNALPY